MSGAQLHERLNRGNLVPLRQSSDLKFEVYASNDEFDSRLRCVITFRIKYGGEKASEEQVFLLAKRIRNDGFNNPKAWKIWRIVTDRNQAECFLGRKL